MFNFPAFDAGAKELRADGHEVISPAELDRQSGINEHDARLPIDFLRWAMKRDLAAICECDGIALLPGWEKSSGVAVELALAKLLGLDIIMCIGAKESHAVRENG